MKLFKKEEGVEENKFMQAWHNKRAHAAMVLGMWFVFLLFVLAISYIGGNSTKYEKPTPATDSDELVFKDYSLMQEELINNNYSYEYKINVNGYAVLYTGEKLGVNETGYKETIDSTTRYYIDDTGIYKVNLNELISYDRLYENVKEELIDIKDIFSVLNEQSLTMDEIDGIRTYTYNYSVDEINYNVTVKTSTDEILNITIKTETDTYELSFSNIGKIQELSYKPM